MKGNEKEVGNGGEVRSWRKESINGGGGGDREVGGDGEGGGNVDGGGIGLWGMKT